MRFIGGNRAVRDHAKRGKALYVFEQDKVDKRFLRYVGEMECLRHSYRDAPDTDGKLTAGDYFPPSSDRYSRSRFSCRSRGFSR